MSPVPEKTWLRASGKRALACLLLVLALAGPIRAGEGIYYTRDTTFLIPFIPDPNEARIQQVLLYVSEDFGKSFQNAGRAGAQEKSFRFTARKDGWYWFWVQTQFQDGKLFPPQLNPQQPGLRVCVDTQPPQLSLKAIQPREGSVAVEWDVREDNPDLQTLRIEYRPQNAGEWINLPVQPLLLGQHSWTPAAPAPQYEVRLQMRDKAGNSNEAKTLVTPGAVAPPQASGAGGNVIMINKRRIQLNYKLTEVGKSNVSFVEVWKTQDTRSWQKYSQEVPSPTETVVIEVPSEGRYGFTLIARSGVGLGEAPPTSGMQPQIWVEVDETKPTVRIDKIEVGQGIETGKLAIRWSAFDRFLALTPITIAYAEQRDGPWQPIVSKIANDGQFVWTMPESLPYKFFVRVEAVDQAGNVGGDQTTEAVAVDLSRPKARIIKVEPAIIPPGQNTPPPPGSPGNPMP